MKFGMVSEKQKQMESGLNLVEIVNKQKLFMKKCAEIEQIKDGARKHAQK